MPETKKAGRMLAEFVTKYESNTTRHDTARHDTTTNKISFAAGFATNQESKTSELEHGSQNPWSNLRSPTKITERLARSKPTASGMVRGLRVSRAPSKGTENKVTRKTLALHAWGSITVETHLARLSI
ncbi:uncharacterized protein SPSK_05682 [Sporothrix schenckii 1099-18]|uniref:Uncharacterized protein n=1 Tax=Sporothrix schenckii 1099-18 TaxID=1397361 RepID=A0A0F2LVH8_SPOSC|nr:uncharacterized protein SPSK_05682 [Sporothrix schenckii 1099-18]KJR80859.1 hypothetical protein SPSK_05682 [Sporothrix schenckii 1099-18]